jgi:thiol-disulfide isomerase/thioredoxin
MIRKFNPFKLLRGLAAAAVCIMVAGAVSDAAVAADAPKKKTFSRVDPPAAVVLSEYSDGERTVTLERYRGRPVLLNVWATWCPPCVKELPALDRLAGKLDGEVHVVALSTDDGGAAQVKPFFDKLAVTRLLALYDTRQRAFQDFSLRGLPTTVLIDAQGRLVARMEGAAEWDSTAMVRQIRQLVGSGQQTAAR